MARIRSVKPEFWKHEKLSELSVEAHMMAASRLNYADDEGYFNANPRLIKAECCPLREISIREAIHELRKVGYVRLGSSSDGRQYGHVITFLDHQVINKAKESRIKQLDILWEPSGTT